MHLISPQPWAKKWDRLLGTTDSFTELAKFNIEGPHHSLKTAVAELLLLGLCNGIIQFQPEEGRREVFVPSDGNLLQAIPSLA